MGFLDTISNAAKDMGDAAAAGVKGVEKAAGDTFHGAVASMKTSAETVVQAGTTLAHGAEQAEHDAVAAVHSHDGLAGLASVHQDLAASAGSALSQAWDGAGKAVGQQAEGLHAAVADTGTAIGRAYDKVSDAATHVTTAVAGKHAGAVVGNVTHAAGAATRVVADGSFSAVTAFTKDIGGVVKGTGDLAIGIQRVASDADYRHKALEKFKGAALAIGDQELAAIRDPAGAKAKFEHFVKGKIEAFNQEGLTAMRDGKETEFVGDKIGHMGAFMLTTFVPEGKVGEVAGAAGRLADGASDVLRATDEADELGRGGELAKAAESTGKEKAAEAASPASGGGRAGEPPEPPVTATGPEPSEPFDDAANKRKSGPTREHWAAAMAARTGEMAPVRRTSDAIPSLSERWGRAALTEQYGEKMPRPKNPRERLRESSFITGTVKPSELDQTIEQFTRGMTPKQIEAPLKQGLCLLVKKEGDHITVKFTSAADVKSGNIVGFRQSLLCREGVRRAEEITSSPKFIANMRIEQGIHPVELEDALCELRAQLSSDRMKPIDVEDSHFVVTWTEGGIYGRFLTDSKQLDALGPFNSDPLLKPVSIDTENSRYWRVR